MVYISGALTALISSLVGAIVGALVTYITKKRVQSRAEDDLLLCLSRAELKRQYDAEIARGWVHTSDVEVYEPMYEAYTRRGGNSVIERLHSQVKQLPIREG